MDARHADGRGPAGRHPGRAPSGAAPLRARGRALAAYPAVGHEQGPGLRPKRAHIVTLDTEPPPGATVLCVDERGPGTPRNFPPTPGWSPDCHRIKAPLNHDRGRDKPWVSGPLAVPRGQGVKRD